MKIIYHTSHCGSTLLTALLSQSTAAFAEPLFKDLIPSAEEIGYTITDHNLQTFYDYITNVPRYKNTVVKLNSSLCFTSVYNSNKKIFLYNNLKRHMYKYVNKEAIKIYHPKFTDFLTNRPHPKVHMNFEMCENNKLVNLYQVSVFMWAHSMLWLLDSKNCLFVNSEEFYFDRQKTVQKICDWFEIDMPKSLDSNYYIDKKKYFDKPNIIKYNEAYTNNLYKEVKDYDTQAFKDIQKYATKYYPQLEKYFENEKHI